MNWIRFTERYSGEDEWMNDIEIAYMLVECDIETLEPLQPINPIVINASVKLAFFSDALVIDDTDIIKLDSMRHDYNGEKMPPEVASVYCHVIGSRTKEYTGRDATYQRVFMDYAWMPWDEYLKELFSK